MLEVRRAEDRSWDAAGTSIPAHVFEIVPAHGRPSELVVDADGWPLELVSQGHGATLRLRRRPPTR